jgi:carboxypeptidase Taq
MHAAKHAQSHTLSDIFKKIVYTAWCNWRWERAKANNDFSLVKAAFTLSVSLSKSISRHKAQLLDKSCAYEALIDEFIPGIKLAPLKPEFKRVFDYCNEQKSWQRNHPRPSVVEDFRFDTKWQMDIDTQMKVCRTLAQKMGFDFSRGHLERGAHPLGVGCRNDTILSVNPIEGDCLIAFMDMIHEVGHGLYRQRLPENWNIHPVGHVASQAMDEALALLMENCVTRTEAGTQFLYNTIHEALGKKPEFSFADLKRRVMGHGPSRIRANANELEYPLHLKIRINILKDIFEDRLDPENLAERWNKEVFRVIGLEVRNDQEGCLQDIHWYAMQHGYFMNYLIGFMMAYQIFETIQHEAPDMLDKIKDSSDFEPLVSWLEEKIFSQGAKYSTMDLLYAITDQKFSADSYIKAMEQKYFPIYAVPKASKNPKDVQELNL